MNRVILDHLARTPGAQLARVRAGKSTAVRIVACYAQDGQHAAWIGKTAYEEAGRARLRTEHRALSHLQRWSGELGVPAVLAWADAGDETCLIQSGAAGHQANIAPQNGAASAEFRQAREWLDRFQKAVAPPEPLTLAEIARETLKKVAAFGRPGCAELGSVLLDGVASRIAPVAVHGDYWGGNLLFGEDGMKVIDWDELSTGSPLEDIFTLILSAAWFATDVESPAAFLPSVFFEPGLGTDLLREAARQRGIGVSEGRFCFYLFLARRTVWKDGEGTWLNLVSELAGRGFPAPAAFA